MKTIESTINAKMPNNKEGELEGYFYIKKDEVYHHGLFDILAILQIFSKIKNQIGRK